MKIYTQEEITRKLNRKKIRNKIIKIMFYPIIILILISNITLIIQKITNPEKIPSLFGYKAFIIVSGSMEPNLNIGDIVIIKEIEKNKLKKNDIITFTQDKQPITHRISDIIHKDSKEYYQTKGDNNTTVDSDLVEYENIEGRYILKIGKVGLIISKLQNTFTFIIAILIIYIVYKIISVKDDRKEARHQKRKKFEEKE